MNMIVKLTIQPINMVDASETKKNYTQKLPLIFVSYMQSSTNNVTIVTFLNSILSLTLFFHYFIQPSKRKGLKNL